MKFFVSTYTEGFFGEGPNGSKGIYLLDYDETNNNLTVLDSYNNSVNPSFIKLTDDKQYLFVACEKLPPSRLDSYLVSKDGSLTFNDSVVLDYRSCCYVSTDLNNQFIAVANYGSGEVFTYSFDENGKFVELTSSNRNLIVGPNKNRQEAPHAHSVRKIDAMNVYVSCDLGCDHIDFYSYKHGGHFTKLYSIDTPPGYGPRHTINTKDGKYLYVTCELENKVLVYEYMDYKYVYKQTISSIPEDYKEQNTCADIHISDDDKYVFVSNRGHDSIGQYEVMQDGSLTLIGFTSCFGMGPRNFALYKNFIIVANQDSNDIKILEIKNGLLTGKVLNSLDFISPVCIEKL